MYIFCIYFSFININQLDALNFILSLFQASTCFEHMCLSSGGQIVLHSLWYLHTYRWPSGARDGHLYVWWYQRLYNTICPPDDKNICSKHVEAWNKLNIKFSASSWLLLINKYIEMHGQQNIKTVKNIRESQKIQQEQPTLYMRTDRCTRTLVILSGPVLLRVRNVSDKIVQTIKTNILC